MSKYFLFTTDVETTSIVNHRLSDRTGVLVTETAVPLILDLYDQYDIKSTFFVTGYFATKFPDSVKEIFDRGHEIGSHGFSHKTEFAFDKLSYVEQKKQLIKSKETIEKIIRAKIVSFRSPALRTNRYTVKALEDTGFQIDSSVSSQRFDFFFSLGAKQKLNWLSSPRDIYRTSSYTLTKKGNSKINEIPISAMIMPYIGTTMRISPFIIRILRKILNEEVKRGENCINFLIHPIELVREKRINEKIKRRSKNYLQYLISDKLRHKIKIKNLGKKAIVLLENQINYFKNRGYQFITCKEYYKRRL